MGQLRAGAIVFSLFCIAPLALLLLQAESQEEGSPSPREATRATQGSTNPIADTLSAPEPSHTVDPAPITSKAADDERSSDDARRDLEALLEHPPRVDDDDARLLAVARIERALELEHDVELARLALGLLAELDPAAFRSRVLELSDREDVGFGLLAGALYNLDALGRDDAVEALARVGRSQAAGAQADEGDLLAHTQRTAFSEGATRELLTLISGSELGTRLTSGETSADERLRLAQAAAGDLERMLPRGDQEELGDLLRDDLLRECQEHHEAQGLGAVDDPDPAEAVAKAEARIDLLCSLPSEVSGSRLLDLVCTPVHHSILSEVAARMASLGEDAALLSGLEARARDLPADERFGMAKVIGLLAERGRPGPWASRFVVLLEELVSSEAAREDRAEGVSVLLSLRGVPGVGSALARLRNGTARDLTDELIRGQNRQVRNRVGRSDPNTNSEDRNGKEERDEAND